MFTDLKYNEDGTIDLIMDHPIHGLIPFTASPNDVEEHGRLIYEKAVAGEYGEIQPYVAPEA